MIELGSDQSKIVPRTETPESTTFVISQFATHLQTNFFIEN